MDGGGRANQRRRTRKDLLQAAGRLMKDGRPPTLEEVAEAALVSRATAYRYFPNVEALLAEASLDMATPDPARLFDGVAPDDPVTRVTLADEALHDMVAANEPALRLLMANALLRATRRDGEEGVPLRQNRRTPLIEAALAPTRRQFKPAAYESLVKALALVLGTEAVIVCKDVLQLSDSEARKVKRWAIKAMIEAARR
jgi:AcrR family transcriptional regulator